MRLSTLFLACFAMASVPALGWAAWNAWSAWGAWANADAAVAATSAMGDALRLMQALSDERDALQEAGLVQASATQDLRQIAERSDGWLDETQSALLAAGLPGRAVVEARSTLIDARAKVAALMRHKLPMRDPSVLPDVMHQLDLRLRAVDAAVAQAQSRAAQANAAIGHLVAAAALATEMHSIAARRASHLTDWFGHQLLSPAQMQELPLLTGQLQQAWDQLRRQVMVAGEPLSLSAAIARTGMEFFRNAEPIYRNYVAQAQAEQAPPLLVDDWRHWSVAVLPATLPARDVAIGEAVSLGNMFAAHARTRMALAVGAAVAALLLAAGALFVLLHRMIRPIQHLTEAVLRLAGGDTETMIPGLARRDEVGAMAAATQVFRHNALSLAQTNARFRASLENMSQALCLFDPQGRLVVSNTRIADIFGPAAPRAGVDLPALTDRAVGQSVLAAADAAWLVQRFQADAGSAEPVAFVWELADGRAFSVHYRPVDTGGWLATFEDVTQQRRAEARIAHLAHHDALTGLPNRVLFRTRLAEALGRIRRGGTFAVLCLDLDHFKAVNDTLGHPLGDALLRAVTERLRATVREGDTCARLGGDEFAVIQGSGNQPQDASALAQRLVATLGAPYEIDGHQVVIGASVGIALAEGGMAADTLLKNADLALYRVKTDGRGAWRYHEPAMDAQMQARRLLELDLRRAVESGAFVLRYQPFVDVRTRRPVGFEALLRWRHVERGLVPPDEFIPLAEEIGLIDQIGDWVLRTACADAASWPAGAKLAVNLSPRQFRDGTALVASVAGALEVSGLAPDRLELEVTEGVLLRDTEGVMATLHRLLRLGVRIAMDDFGTGYSSLNYLQRFPFSRVKIDRSFVRGVADNRGDCQAIVRAVLGLCGSLGISTTAEGVETPAQLDCLAAQGCSEVQGFLFSRPVTAAEVPGLAVRVFGQVDEEVAAD